MQHPGVAGEVGIGDVAVDVARGLECGTADGGKRELFVGNSYGVFHSGGNLS